ncbi:alpha/beta fold hydrolase [Altererythrobacter xixiisoli]|uniref:Alpha/beta fold hydrolase n=1 Tax=Croceibacterium xixiisoli TaxID=1476466 RepID=A0A6I4TUQ7_9SPHN|nr:alpha/beta hydrolase [Croceibacterium xixiisoli]MXO99684.1 alpha/beta fold hydrolase [Croceibacterium xixiisoli]
MSEPVHVTGQWQTADGLTLSYRDFPGPADAAGRPPLLCLHGLTRNGRDFEPLIERFAADWRIIVPDMRGRGQSDYARDTASYVLPSYIADVELLLAQLELNRFVGVGTSMGALILTGIALGGRDRLAGVIINDIGPEIEADGLERIVEYVGQGRSFPTWMHAARGLRDQAEVAHPDFTITQWLAMAKRLMCLSGNGRIVFDYDMKIAEPFASAGNPGAETETPAPAAASGLWPGFEAFGGRPGLVLRGEVSDLLSAATVDAMTRRIAGLQAVVVPRTGHAPTLEEPAAQAAIAALLARIG